MSLQRGQIFLPVRGRFDFGALIAGGGLAPPWLSGGRTRPWLERPERLPDGSVRLLRICAEAGGIVLQVTGRAARDIETLAPLAVRVRRALGLDARHPGGGARPIPPPRAAGHHGLRGPRRDPGGARPRSIIGSRAPACPGVARQPLPGRSAPARLPDSGDAGSTLAAGAAQADGPRSRRRLGADPGPRRGARHARSARARRADGARRGASPAGRRGARRRRRACDAALAGPHRRQHAGPKRRQAGVDAGDPDPPSRVEAEAAERRRSGCQRGEHARGVARGRLPRQHGRAARRAPAIRAAPRPGASTAWWKRCTRPAWFVNVPSVSGVGRDRERRRSRTAPPRVDRCRARRGTAHARAPHAPRRHRPARQVGPAQHERLQRAGLGSRRARSSSVARSVVDTLQHESLVFGFLSALMRKSSWYASGGDHEMPATVRAERIAIGAQQMHLLVRRLRRHDDADRPGPCCAPQPAAARRPPPACPSSRRGTNASAARASGRKRRPSPWRPYAVMRPASHIQYWFTSGL